MYFPYLRGRQYELIALRELVLNDLLDDQIIPIVEPVKLSPTLVTTMNDFVCKKHPLSIIRNPVVGTFMSDWHDAQDASKEASYKERFANLYDDKSIIKSLIMQKNSLPLMKHWTQKGINNQDLLVINTNRDYLDIYSTLFGQTAPRYTLIPDESSFKRRVHQNKVLLNDNFDKQSRNADYLDLEDSFFTEDHLYYKDDGFVGFSDYSIVGNEYLEAGFAPYAVAIHIVYFAENNTLRIKHFVSDSNEDISNPALKYFEAVSKLEKWYRENPNIVDETLGIKTFLEHFKNESYPGLGTVKKLSIMHHLELIGNYLKRV